jgi:hypothetical protein
VVGSTALLDDDDDDDTGAFELISINVGRFNETRKLTYERETFYTMKINLPTAAGPWWTATVIQKPENVKRGGCRRESLRVTYRDSDLAPTAFVYDTDLYS